MLYIFILKLFKDYVIFLQDYAFGGQRDQYSTKKNVIYVYLKIIKMVFFCIYIFLIFEL